LPGEDTKKRPERLCSGRDTAQRTGSALTQRKGSKDKGQLDKTEYLCMRINAALHVHKYVEKDVDEILFLRTDRGYARTSAWMADSLSHPSPRRESRHKE